MAKRPAANSIVILIVLILVTFNLHAAEVPFSAAQTIDPLFDGVLSIHAADIDGDGDIDLAGAAASAGEVAWWENSNGDGASWAKTTVGTNLPNVRCVYAADVDGDGDLDLLGAVPLDDEIIWWQNTSGDGSAWTEHILSASFDSAVAVAAGDVDGDGDIDVLGAASGGDEISWWQNTAGDGTAWIEHSVATGFNDARAVQAADVDGDGDLDVVGAAWTAQDITWWENTAGDGTTWTEHLVDGAFNGATSVVTADVDGDGDVDIVGAAYNVARITWWENTAGDGSTWITHDVSVTFDFPFSVSVADVDRDGDVDIVGAGYDEPGITWWESTAGDGSTWLEHLVGAFPGAIAGLAPDLDGDGDLDIVGANALDEILWWPAETIHRSASYDPSGLVIAPALTQPYSITTADLDGDGDLDALTAANGSSRVSWWVNDGSPKVADWTELVIDTGPAGAKRATAGDVDGDGDLDVLIAAAGSNNTLAWLESDGTPADGGWTEHVMYTGSPFYDVFSADIDSDGDLDMIHAVNETPGTVAWSENDGTPADGGWIEHVLANDLAGAITVTARDLDGDGDVDIVAGGYDEPGEIRWWESDGSPGDGGWTEHQVVADLGSVEDLVAEDLDLDGDLDIIAALKASSDIRWWESDGSPADGGWIEHVVTNWRATQIAVGDADADGDIDILGAGNSVEGDGLRCYESDGSPADGGWLEHDLPAAFSRGAHLSDIDGDGDLDALGAVTGADQVLWWPNLGGQFALPTVDAVISSQPNEGSEALALEIGLAHRGRVGDDDVELATLELLLEASAGIQLSATELANLADRIYLYLDDGDSSWDAQDAVLSVIDPPYTLTNGVMTVVLPDNNLDLQTGFGSAKTYFVTLDLTASSGTASPDSIVVTHLTASSSTGEMASTDLPLLLEYHADTSATALEVNAAPILDITIGPQLAVVGETAVIDVSRSFSDPEADSLSMTATGLPASLTISASGIVSGIPLAADVAGSPYSVLVTASDQWGASVDDSFELTVLSEQAMYSSAQLYWTVLDGEVWRSHADGSNLQMVVGSTGAITTVVFDATNEHLYYATGDGDIQGYLFRCDLDGSNQQRLVSGLDEIGDLELDPNAGKIYWTEAGSGRIRRANLDGSSPETLLSGLSDLWALGLDLEAGTMSYSRFDQVYAAGLDGSGVTQILTATSVISEIEIDTTNDKLYYARGNMVLWCELDGTGCADLVSNSAKTIQIAGSSIYLRLSDQNLWRADLDGANLQQVSAGLEMPLRFALGFDNQMYLADGSIRRYDLDGSNETSIAAGAAGGVHDVAVDMVGHRFFFSDFEQDAVVTRSFGSSDLLHLSADSASATEIRGLALHPVTDQLFWANTQWSETGAIWSIGVDGNGLTNVVGGLAYPHDVALDTTNGKVFWTEKIDDSSGSTGVIRRANLDGSGVEDVLTGLPTGIRGLAVDDVNGTIYWTDHQSDEIWRAGLDGGSPAVVLSGLDMPHDVAVDPAAGFLYWTEGIGSSADPTGAIRRANLDGSSVVDIHTGLSEQIRDLTVVMPVQSFTLTMSSVTGDGTVNAPAGIGDGISCGFGGEDNCDETYLDGAAVTLTASPEPGWAFASWGGDAACLDGVVDMTVDVMCTATFTNNFHLAVSVQGPGTGTIALDLDPGWIDCGAQCSEDFPLGNLVTIIPQPDANSLFVIFEGDPECLPDGVIEASEAVRDLSCAIRFESIPIFADGFEEGNASAWSATVF